MFWFQPGLHACKSHTNHPQIGLQIEKRNWHHYFQIKKHKRYVGGFGPKPQIIFHFRKLFSGEGRWGGSLKHVIIVILPFQLQTSLSRIPNVINQKCLRFSAANNAVVTCFSVSISTCLSSRWKAPRNKLTAALYALYRKAKGYLVEIWWLSNSEEPTVHAATSPASHWSINRGGQSTNCDENCN